MKKYLTPAWEMLTFSNDVIMASTEIGANENETAKDYIADLVIGNVDNI